MTLMMMKKLRLIIAVAICGGSGLLLTFSGRPPSINFQSLLVQNSNGSEKDVIVNQSKGEKLAKFKDLIAKHQNSSLISNETIQALLNITLQDKPNSQRSNQKKPMQIIIATTFRSGSSFLSELLSSHPGVFTHFEPLFLFKEKRIYKGDNSSCEAVQYLATLLKCGYNDKIFFHGRAKFYLPTSHNPRLLHLCNLNNENRKLCYQNDLLEATCSIFPWHVMKLVRAGVDLLEPIFEDKSLNPHLIVLFRDPRAIINSRLLWPSFQFFMSIDPLVVCRYMNQDFKAARRLSKKYPDRVHILRYEDLAWTPSRTSQKLLKRIGMNSHPDIVNYIKSHTVNENKIKDPVSTNRDSANRVLNWVMTMNETSIHSVQSSCHTVMSRLGYLQIISRNQLAKLRSSNNFIVDSMNDSVIKVQSSKYEKLYRKISF